MNPDPLVGADPEPSLVTVERPIPGGVMLGRQAGGRVVLVEGGVPGEVVRVEPMAGKGKVLRGRVVAVVGPPSPDRAAPPCPHVADGCGGCDWQHVDVGAQPRFKREVVVDALRRIGGIAAPAVDLAPPLPAEAYRTTVHAHVDLHGRAGHFAARSHDVVPADSCLVAHPLVEEVLVHGRFPRSGEVTVRASVATHDRIVLVDTGADVVAVPPGVVVAGRPISGGVWSRSTSR